MEDRKTRVEEDVLTKDEVPFHSPSALLGVAH